MKKYLSIILAILMALAMFAGCSSVPGGPAEPQEPDSPPPLGTPQPAPADTSSQPEAPAEPVAPAEPTDPSMQAIKDKGFFILGLDDSFPPMGYRDNNDEIVGFDIDLARECAKKMGIDVKLQPLDWNFISEELNGNKVDVIWNGCTITEDRKKSMAFTEPYLLNTQIAVVLADAPYTSLKEFAGKKAGIQTGSSALIALDNNPQVRDSLTELRQYDKNDKAMLDLSAKRIDCVFVDVTVFIYYDSLKPGTYRMLDENLGAEEFGIATRIGDESFRFNLQKALDECYAQGIVAQLATKWFKTQSVLAK